jgi:phage shock protein PspC (stress-responsive transcriptional regulator)
MNEIKKCSISGIAFTLDADAYEVLRTYLDSLEKTYEKNPDGAEIIADIEARIAELILSTQNNARVVERPLIENIVKQLGSAADITGEDPDSDLHYAEPRIPRRLYRDTENAKLGGVCSGIGRYFDVDPVWIRLVLFLPLLLSCFGWLPLLHWTGPMMGNLFGIFVICYFIMWFAVPAARTARQKLEMQGERITEQSIRETTAASYAAADDPDSRARPIVAEAVSVFGKVVLIFLKLIAGLIVFGLIMGACALIIGLFAVVIGGGEILMCDCFDDHSLWLPVLGIVVVLIPTILLIYVLMCLIASRKPGGRAVLAIFLLWLASIVALSVTAVRGNVGDRLRRSHDTTERLLNTPMVIDSDTTTLEELLHDFDEDTSIVDTDGESLHISVPSRSIDITIDKKAGRLNVTTDEVEAAIAAAQ